MKVRFIKAYRGHRVGQVAEFDAATSKALIAIALAVEHVEPKPAKKAEKKAED